MEQHDFTKDFDQFGTRLYAIVVAVWDLATFALGWIWGLVKAPLYYVLQHQPWVDHQWGLWILSLIIAVAGVYLLYRLIRVIIDFVVDLAKLAGRFIVQVFNSFDRTLLIVLLIIVVGYIVRPSIHF